MDGNLNLDKDGPGVNASTAKRSGTGVKPWIFVFLGLIALLVGGVYVANRMLDKPMLEFQNSNIDLALTSPDVESALGSPVSPGTVKIETLSADKRKFVVQLKGAKAEGVLVFEGTKTGEEWTRDSIFLKANGQQVDLDPEAIFNLDIDMGD